MIKVLFICMGNICRSPTAHGVFRQMLIDKKLTDLIEVDSAGTHAYHVGKSPDGRSVQSALSRGIDFRDLTARQLDDFDFEEFDHLLVADSDNFHLTQQACPKEHRHKIKYMLDFASGSAFKEVPDPYYGEGNGFERVLDLIEDACEGLLDELSKDLKR
ncbi:MAG: low molecular weight protein-tyrosine-phosphatase [Cycloclasticus sp.]|nr:low molecular weight protein-tyrosine-phosphatase [Cycloclasticus sp.]